MYTRFYGLREKPFSIVPDPGRLFLTEKHRLALTYLQYGLRENVGFVLFTGEIGAGKTTTIRHLLKEFGGASEVAVIFNTNVSSDELIKLILIEFEVQETAKDKAGNLDLLNQRLIDLYRQGKRSIIIIDEAQNLSWEALEEVRLLSNLQADTQSLLQIILVGQPELRNMVESPRLKQLAQRIAVNFHLPPLTREEANEYVAFRLRMAGREAGELFEPEAVGLIHETSGGIPRTINILCDAALVYGYADDAELITVDIIRQVLDEQGMMLLPQGLGWASGKSRQSIPPTGQAAGEDGCRALHEQIAALSARVDSLAADMLSRFRAGDDRLVENLQRQLSEERGKSEKLLAKLVAQQKDILRLKEHLDRPDERQPIVKPEQGRKKNAYADCSAKKRFLSWLKI